MNVLRMQVVRNRDDALITKDRMRVDIESEFYIRVPPTRDAVTIAAATLGRRTMNVADSTHCFPANLSLRCALSRPK